MLQLSAYIDFASEIRGYLLWITNVNITLLELTPYVPSVDDEWEEKHSSLVAGSFDEDILQVTSVGDHVTPLGGHVAAAGGNVAEGKELPPLSQHHMAQGYGDHLISFEDHGFSNRITFEDEVRAFTLPFKICGTSIPCAEIGGWFQCQFLIDFFSISGFGGCEGT